MAIGAHPFNETALLQAGISGPACGDDGRGIAIALVDYGFDVLHPALCDARGRSRFACLLDQNAGAGGRELAAGDLDALIGAARSAGHRGPADRVYDPHANHFGGAGGLLAAHGTMMASIAAGSAVAGFRGAAPAARLVGVQLAVHDADWKEQDAAGAPAWRHWHPGSEPLWAGWRSYDACERLSEALDFAVDRAAGLGVRGLVVNLSIGAYAGAHDGCSPVETRIADILARAADAKGLACAVVVAAGNAGAQDGHFREQAGSGRPLAFEWRMHGGQERQKKLEIWYRAPRPLRPVLALLADGQHIGTASATLEIPPAGTTAVVVAGRRVGIAEHTARARGPLSRVRILVHPPWLPAELRCRGRRELRWLVRFLSDADMAPATLHAWVEREDDAGERATLFPSHPESTLTTLATADGAIAVAGHHHRRGEAPALFAASSLGPAPWRPRPLPAPALSAPAHGIWAAQSKTGGFLATSGTSAAAAFVSGAVALLMQRAARHGQRLAAGDAVRLLTRARACGAPSAGGRASWSPRAGHGPLELGAQVEEAAA